MSWAIGFDHRWQRDVGYGVPAECDQPDCKEKIDRGLSYICGGEMYGGEDGCGLFFCLAHGGGDLCERCHHGAPPFAAKPDLPEWIHHKETDPSWAAWLKTRQTGGKGPS
jgi:hypothetical protein